MDLLHGALLVVAGIAGGCIAAIVGGAAVITFPALLAAGLPPVMATAANTVALTPGLFLAAIYDRSQLPPFDRSFVAVALASIVGAVIGAVLLVLTPERVFSALVPLLLGFATVLFAYAGRISTWLAANGGNVRRFTHSPAVVLTVSVYGGYFGAGVGVLMLGVLSVGTAGNYRSANVTKNLVTGLNSAAATVIFAAQGVVSWPATLLMMAGTLVGGLIGARLAQVLPNHAARTLVVFVGALLTAVFAWRYWF
ncbi:MAG TPA: sulfite exporter TauE/SafE family protein [Xanthobacteraceae bacterium]|nr:sulfite exporter TauE/SafE family protein [Xanthobacteraceae bacterium]